MSTDSKHHKQKIENVSCAVLTVSDTRTQETDESGKQIRNDLESAGHQVCHYEIIPDEPDQVRQRVIAWCGENSCQAILLTGGTGLSNRDTTYEALESLLEKHLDGFGELFRMLSYEQIGAAAMLSRATAGVYQSTLIFSMPGSTAAVRLAMQKLILPEIGHMVALVTD